MNPGGGGDRTVRVTVPVADAELAADRLWQAGASAIAEREVHGAVVLEAGGDPASLLAAVAGSWPAEAVVVDLDAALDAWRPYARAVRVGERLAVRPPWLPPVGAELEVVVDPGRAFGSGAHPSTRLALATLVERVRPGDRVLDVGCGSGVLALAALALGASAAVGVDIDPAAREVSAANGVRNGAAGRLAVTDLVGGRYPLVVANLLLPDLVALAPAVTGAVEPGGALVASGVLDSQRAAVEAAYDLRVVEARLEDGWLALILAP
jgi:ribosomal protein L11 methyltransferase